MNYRYLPLAITAALFMLMFAASAMQFSGFGSLRVFMNLFTDNAFLVIVAVGMTFVILSGGIDLSVGAVVALTGVVCSVLIEHYHWHPSLVFPLVLMLGTLFGSLMGCLIHFYQIQPFIVTLAGMFMARGLATTISEQSVPINHSFYTAINNFGVSLPGNAWLSSGAMAMFVVLALAVYVLHYTRLGGYIYALGGDRQSARLMGVPIGRTTVSIYAISSTLAAMGGIVYSSYTSSGYALATIGLELDAIAAVVIGGTLLSGGSGYVVGTLIGVMIMGVIQTYISFHGSLNSWWTRIVIGALLLFFIGMQRVLLTRHSKRPG